MEGGHVALELLGFASREAEFSMNVSDSRGKSLSVSRSRRIGVVLKSRRKIKRAMIAQSNEI